ncbi:MAG: retropepsin-like domain-containing protein [candidate division Zixibacteria bacterium]|nr:retropepsin-like domain-containing protein [candidate division Zixibacteria bacterium]
MGVTWRFTHCRSTLLSFALIFCAGTIAHSQSGPLEFDPRFGLVLFQAEVNGATIGKFGIDTGADGFYVSDKFARKSGLRVSEPDQTRVVRGVVGSSPVAHATFRSFAIGEETLYNLPVEVINLDLLSGRKAELDGLVGFSVLRNFYVTIDYPSQSIELFTQEPKLLKANSNMTGSFSLRNHLIVVDVSLNGGGAYSMVIDYCASSSLIIPEIASQFGSASTDEYLEIDSARVGPLAVGKSRFWIKPLSSFKESSAWKGVVGIIGFPFLRDNRITIDYVREKFYLHSAK